MGGGITFIQVPTTSGQTTLATASDTAAGQAHYALTATATAITVYATVNLPDTNSDSFHHQITGLETAWVTQNGTPTVGFQEINLGTVPGAVIGKGYTLKIERRENGAQLDRFRLVGANFNKGGPAPIVVVTPKPYDLAKGKVVYERDCAGCHGGTANMKGLNNTRSLAFIETNTRELGMPVGGPICNAQCIKDVSAYIFYGLYKKPEPQ